jgi:hemerythrin superfamily protein
MMELKEAVGRQPKRMGHVSNGDAGVVELLMRDHQVLLGLVEQLDTEEDPARLTSLFDVFVRKLAAHEPGEQQVVFPAFRDEATIPRKVVVVASR